MVRVQYGLFMGWLVKGGRASGGDDEGAAWVMAGGAGIRGEWVDSGDGIRGRCGHHRRYFLCYFMGFPSTD